MFKPGAGGPIHLCVFCGERCKSTYCNSCKLAEGRKKKVIEQVAIDSENRKKGYNIPKIIFGFPREILIQKLKVKL